MFGFTGMGKLAAVAMLAVGGMMMVPTSAQAKDVDVRFGINTGPRYYHPPIVVTPRYPGTTYYYSQPYYSTPYYYSQPYYGPRYYYSTPRYYYGRDYNRHHHHHHHHGGHHHHHRGHNHRR
jgi:hypothetical protein